MIIVSILIILTLKSKIMKNLKTVLLALLTILLTFGCSPTDNDSGSHSSSNTTTKREIIGYTCTEYTTNFVYNSCDFTWRKTRTFNSSVDLSGVTREWTCVKPTANSVTSTYGLKNECTPIYSK